MMTPGITSDQTIQQKPNGLENYPGQLALFAANFLKQSSRFKGSQDIFLLDLACGPGQDPIYLAQNLPCHILAVDNSASAVESAREILPKDLEKRVELLCYEFSQLNDRYDVIFVSNLYHRLGPEERSRLRETIRRCLKIGGILFLSALSIKDPQHFGKGQPVEGESNSFWSERYLHFSTREDLTREFDFIRISALFESAFVEVRAEGNHHHVDWILMGSLDQ
jgi:SAM-dependent methyltransferase